MNYATIKNTDIANGQGVRISLFVSGCTHHCKNCFNQEAWDFNFGKPFTVEVEDQILKLCEASYIRGLTLLGGEPMHPNNQQGIYNLVKRFREKFGNKKDIWCYSGYIFDKDFVKGGRAYTDKTDFLLDNFDVLVDGPFIDEQKDISLKFRGSRNQRIINVKESRKKNKIVLYME